MGIIEHGADPVAHLAGGIGDFLPDRRTVIMSALVTLPVGMLPSFGTAWFSRLSSHWRAWTVLFQAAAFSE
jgi:hypothetical protein